MADVKEALYQAMQDIASSTVGQLKTDKTVTAVIVQCNNALTGEHQVNYQGGNMIAWTEDGTVYNKNSTVYVLVPEGDFSKKKVIIGRASAVGDDNNITFVSSVLNDYNPIGRNVIKPKTENSFYLHSYLANDYFLIYDYDNQKESLVDIDIEEFQNYLREATAIQIEASFQTRLPKEHRNTKTGIYGLQFVLAFKDRSTNEDILKTYSYTIDTNSMTGNPYAFSNWSEQYGVFPIDIENFSHIQSIFFWSRGFVDKDDKINNELWGADIWCKNLEIYGLKPITNQQGDYRLKISAPYGATFKTETPNESLEFVASVRYQNTYLSESCMYYWFIEDARVTTSDPNYQMYGGTGWRRLRDKGTGTNFITYERENHAYENKYLCVAVYKEEVVLKDYFTVYNDACRRDIEVVSNLGNVFSFDRGSPTLTCLLDGKDEKFDLDNATKRPDSWFTFVWSKIDEYGQVTPFNQTLDELKEEYKQAEREGWGYTALSVLKTQIAMMEGVEFPKGLNGNQMIYPVSAIANYATFRCSVYLKDSENGQSYSIGSKDIILQNENAADPVDYHILIENGDQVFQYSESGVTPTSDRYIDPQIVKPLIPHFYDPAGLEVNPGTYVVTWVVPLEDTMIKIPTDLVYNPATEKIEWFVSSKQFPLDIVDNFDYSALNNQLTCIVEYNGQQYTKDTRLSFVKIGDNGTNGTDVIAIISDSSNSTILDKDMLTLERKSDGTVSWNTGQIVRDKVLNFNLYQRDEKLVVDSTVFWTIAGGSSTLINILSGDAQGCAVNYGSSSDKAKDKNLIVKAQTTLRNPEMDSQTTYYAFRQIPVIQYNTARTGYKLHIDTDFTLKQILYNADGRNPLYNKNQGLRLRIDDPSGFANKTVYMEAIGGVGVTGTERESRDTASFQLLVEKNTKDGHQYLNSHFDENGIIDIYILPADVYSGMYTNNMVHGKIFTGNSTTGTPECEFWVPIHMQLNTYGLKSLNSWDGNHIEINEEDNYILAPQIGAGEKDNENKFTGVVMGTQQTYDDQKNKKIGLMGYSHGKQSIWLDSETGNATFGLTENDPLDPNNPLTEGRIELRPGGISSISNWKLDSRSFYNVVAGEIGNAYSDAPGRGTDNPAKRSIPNWLSGVILNSSPAYIAVKGERLLGNSKVDFDDPNAIIKEGDTFELQFNPNDYSIFTLYRHTNTIDDNTFSMTSTDTSGYYVVKDGTNLVYTRAIYKQNTADKLDRNNIIGWTLVNPIGTSERDSTKFIIPEFSGKEGWALREATSIDGKPLVKGDTVNIGVMRDRDGEWRRTPIVGINAQGRFYSNALQDSTTSLNIGMVGGFGIAASEKRYVGASIDLFSGTGTNLNNAKTLIKFFADYNTITDTSAKVFISGSSSLSNEYYRPLSFHGKSIELYATGISSGTGVSNRTAQTSNNRIILDTTESTIGNADSYLQLKHSGQSIFNIKSTLKTYVTNTTESEFNGDVTAKFNKKNIKTVEDTETSTIKGIATYNLNAQTGTNQILSPNTDFNLQVRGNTGWQFKADSQNARVGSVQGAGSSSYNGVDLPASGHSFITFSKTGRSYYHSSNGINIMSGTGGLTLGTSSADQGIRLYACGASSTSLSSCTSLWLHGTTGGNGDFVMQSPHGKVESKNDIGNGLQGVQITSGIASNWAYFVGGSSNSAQSSGTGINTSIYAANSIYSGGGLMAQWSKLSGSKKFNETDTNYSAYMSAGLYSAGTVKSESFKWRNDKPWTWSFLGGAASGGKTSNDLYVHIDYIYSIFGQLEAGLRPWLNKYLEDNNYLKKDKIEELVNNKLKDYVKTTDYNKHRHNYTAVSAGTSGIVHDGSTAIVSVVHGTYVTSAAQPN